jgi:hypothetical protein
VINIIKIKRNRLWHAEKADGNGLKYHLLLRDKIARVDEKPLISLRAHSSDPKNLINLLELYLEICEY